MYFEDIADKLCFGCHSNQSSWWFAFDSDLWKRTS